jgi:hypothetical protein
MSAERPGISGCIRSGDEILEASVLGTRHLGSLNCNERKPHTSGQYILPMVFNKLFELQGAFGASVQSERSRDCRDMAWWPANEPIRSDPAVPNPVRSARAQGHRRDCRVIEIAPVAASTAPRG